MARHERTEKALPHRRLAALIGSAACAAVLAAALWIGFSGGGKPAGVLPDTSVSTAARTDGSGRSLPNGSSGGQASRTEGLTSSPSSTESAAPTPGYTDISGTDISGTVTTETGTETAQPPHTTDPPAPAASDSVPPPTVPTTGPTQPPTDEPKEQRAVWISYIELDSWLRGTADAARQRIDALMEACVSCGLNTVLFQVRPNSNAYYASDCYPVAEAAGRMLKAGLDPLQYAVEAAHARGLELHAWVNPYRVGGTSLYAVVEDYFSYGGRVYYIPSSPAVQRLILSGIEELTERYAVDGIHFDDYFYPDGSVPADSPASFEEVDFAAYRAAGGTAAVGDWRREQVTALLRAVYRTAHAHGGVFGVSPVASFETNREKKYADVAAWMAASDIVDYICPQIYFGLQNGSMPFERVLAQWCARPRSASVRLYIGLGLYKAGMPEDTWAGSGRYEWAAGGDILARELRALRQQEAVSGFALYSYDYLNPERFTRPVNGVQHDAAVARREIENLREELKRS